MVISMIKGVAFDMDGLMFDTERLIVKAWGIVGEPEGYHITEDIVVETLGLNIEDTRRVFLRHLGNDFNFYAIRKLRDHYITGYMEENGIPVKAGLVELLAYLKSNDYKTAVVTSTEREKAGYFLGKAGISDCFDGIVCGDMVELGKPKPDIYLKASEVMGVAPNECLALEDSPFGILSAYRAGMKPVMIPDLVKPDEATGKILFAVLPTLSDVIGLLSRQGG